MLETKCFLLFPWGIKTFKNRILRPYQKNNIENFFQFERRKSLFFVQNKSLVNNTI